MRTPVASYHMVEYVRENVIVRVDYSGSTGHDVERPPDTV
jgi:hypothetical protein